MIEVLATIGRFGLFGARVARATLTHRPPVARSMEEAYRIGVRSLPILLVISAFVGTNLCLQGHAAFQELGGQSLVGSFVAMAGVREMAPIMVAAMVAAKAGTEMASQLAVMRIREQIDALEVMAIDPYAHLVTPRFLGIAAVLPPLTIISIFTLVVSGWAVGVYQLGLDGDQFIHQATAAVEAADLWRSGVKAVVFSTVICLVSTFTGFYSSPGPDGVGRATNAAVVASAVICAILNYLLSEAMYG